MISLEVRINKEVRDYQESIFFGLSLRQCLFSLFAVAVAVGLYVVLHRFVEGSGYDWLCVLAAFPSALGGFFQYNGMTAGRFLLAVVRTVCYTQRGSNTCRLWAAISGAFCRSLIGGRQPTRFANAKNPSKMPRPQVLRSQDRIHFRPDKKKAAGNIGHIAKAFSAVWAEMNLS